MENFWIVLFICGGFVAVVLTLLLIRGRFGTPQEQADYEVRELLHSDDVPAEASRRSIATCHGHTASTRQILGIGVLWASDDAVGFVLRRPRRHFRIKRSAVAGARQSASFQRTGVEETIDHEGFLLVDWNTSDRTEQIVFQLEDPAPWVDELTGVSS